MIWTIHHRHDHYYHDQRLDEVRALLINLRNLVSERFAHMSKELDDLTAQVKANSALLDSATTLINGIAARIDAAVAAAQAAGADPATLKQLTDLSAELKAKDDTLATAITENTPAAG